MLSRRKSLSLVGAVALSAALPVRVAVAAPPTDRRLVVIILRGGLDGLAAVVPYGDPSYSVQRTSLAFEPPGADEGPLDLDGFFGLHPSLETMHALYRQKELIVFHAVATPYRRRSHFDAQDLLENGTATPSGARSGWLNRALSLYGHRETSLGLAIGTTVPLILRGDAAVGAFAPRRLAQAGDDFLSRMSALYQTDALLGPVFAEAVRAQEMNDEILGRSRDGKGKRVRRAESLPAVARDVGKLLRHPGGARIAVLDIGGWDTHANQGVLTGRLARSLKGLDDGVAALKETLSSVWEKTAILVMSEFGRTVRPNGTNGTDHGIAGVAMLAGGGLAGGRLIADWPGLSAERLHEGRDLSPTMDLRAVTKAVAIDHLGLTAREVEARVFPNSGAVARIRDLFPF